MSGVQVTLAPTNGILSHGATYYAQCLDSFVKGAMVRCCTLNGAGCGPVCNAYGNARVSGYDPDDASYDEAVAECAAWNMKLCEYDWEIENCRHDQCDGDDTPFWTDLPASMHACYSYLPEGDASPPAVATTASPPPPGTATHYKWDKTNCDQQYSELMLDFVEHTSQDLASGTSCDIAGTTLAYGDMPARYGCLPEANYPLSLEVDAGTGASVVAGWACTRSGAQVDQCWK